MATPPTGVTQGELNEIFGRLTARGETAKQEFIAGRTPAELQPNLADYQGTIAPPLSQGSTVHVLNAAGVEVAGSPGVAQVSGGVLTSVKLTV